MASQTQYILQQLGLSDGYHIPIANDENLKLEAELQRLIAAKANATATLDSISGRLRGLNKHNKYVQAEQTENQNILFARNAQLQNEKHMYTLSRLEREHCLQDLKNMSNKLGKLEESKKNKCQNLKCMMSKMDKLKLSVQWDEQVLEVLEESVVKKSDDNDVIKKFSKEDRKKAEELEMKRKKLREEELLRRQLVVRIANEIECLQLAIGRNGQIYKQLCEERNNMVRSWQEAVKQLQQRNKDTIATEAEIATVQDAIAANNAIFEEQKQFAENERANNLELEERISADNAEVARSRIRLSKYLTLVQNRGIELNGIQRELQRTATALEGERAERRRQLVELETQNKLLEKAMAVVERLKEQLTAIQTSNLTSEERLRQLEDMVQAEEANAKNLAYDTERMQGALYRSRKLLAGLAEDYKMKEMAQRVEEQAIITLQQEITQVEANSRQFTEIIYKMSFRCNMLENRVGRISGIQPYDNAEQHQERLIELQQTMDSVSETGNMLQNQITRLEEDMRRLSTSTSADTEVLQTISDRLHDRMLMVDGAVKLVAQRRTSNNSLKVQQNVLAVRVKGAENSLNREGGVVFGLQRQRMELEAAVQERQAELTVERELLITKKRSLVDDSGRLRGDKELRKIKIDQLKKRLECILESLGKAEDGEEVSVTYFRVKYAQEKFALQKEGDRLDAIIKKAEAEIVAMENTLRVVNSTNDAYRKSLDVLDDDATELTKLRCLEERLKDLEAEIRSLLNILTERGKVLRALRVTLENARSKCHKIASELAEIQLCYKEIQQEETERKIKMDRASVAIPNSDCVCDDRYKDMIFRQLKELNISGISQLLEMSQKYIETGPTVNRYLNEHKIHIPHSLSRSSNINRTASTRSSSSLSGKSATSSSGIIPAVFLTLNL